MSTLALPAAIGRARPARRAIGDRALAAGLMAPAVIVTLALVLYPLIRVAELSLRTGRAMNLARLGALPLGWANYTHILGDAAFWHSVSVSGVYVACSVAGAFLLGLATALLLAMRFPGRRVCRTLLLLPWAVPGVVASIVFRWMFDGSFGVVNALLRRAGVLDGDLAWYVDSRTAMLAVIMPTVWKAYPLITLTLLAAIQTIPGELYEAAEVDGASAASRFVHITWPGIAGAGALAALASALWIFRDVDIIFAATRGGPARATETMALYVYDEAFQFLRMGTASAAGAVMVTLALCVTAMGLAYAGRQRL